VATNYVLRLQELCTKAGVAIPDAIRADQKLTVKILTDVLAATAYVNTTLTTTAATAAHLVNTKEAYVNGVKITGTNANLVDTTIASNGAVAAEIAVGKFAYVNGVLIEGTAV
jgi:hypothetical protein